MKRLLVIAALGLLLIFGVKACGDVMGCSNSATQNGCSSPSGPGNDQLGGRVREQSVPDHIVEP